MDPTGVVSDTQGISECVAIPLEQDEAKSDASPPSVPSGFLCPSNLGALLESTTVSLVSGGWKESTEKGVINMKGGVDEVDISTHTYDLDETQAETLPFGSVKAPEKGDTVNVTLQQEHCSPERLYSADDQQISPEVQEIFPPCSFQPGKGEENGSTEILSNPDLPQLASPAPIYPCTSLSVHHSPVSLHALPRATIGESHSPCYGSDIDLRHHQLCIAIDEDSPVTYTPSFSRNLSCGSQRSSVCSSAVNEGDVPGIVRYDYRTHSRNVSETPSLPPFYSSSTSSAYHSRNSSLGSQLSSCFESDSMLNQLTDIDSCLAVQTGSHSDLKQLVRKPDSRFSKQGDSSPSSYSSDLSLHQHMSKPLNPSDTIVSMSPLNLEDTLRSLSTEKLDECKKYMTMKSSEWIKHQLECHRDSLVVVKVSSKTKHVVHFNVKAGDVIIWEFATKKKDIAFGVSFEATEVATAQSPLPDSHESMDNKMLAILPTFRVCTHAHPAIGTHTATLDGIYEISFDNTYSRFFAKELYYRITTQPSKPNVNYLQQ